MNIESSHLQSTEFATEPALKGLAPYAGFAAHAPYLADAEQKLKRKIVATLPEAIARVGLRDGMTISFHHGFREGDRTINHVVQTLAELGFRDLTLGDRLAASGTL